MTVWYLRFAPQKNHNSASWTITVCLDIHDSFEVISNCFHGMFDGYDAIVHQFNEFVSARFPNFDIMFGEVSFTTEYLTSFMCACFSIYPPLYEIKIFPNGGRDI